MASASASETVSSAAPTARSVNMNSNSNGTLVWATTAGARAANSRPTMAAVAACLPAAIDQANAIVMLQTTSRISGE